MNTMLLKSNPKCLFIRINNQTTAGQKISSGNQAQWNSNGNQAGFLPVHLAGSLAANLAGCWGALAFGLPAPWQPSWLPWLPGSPAEVSEGIFVLFSFAFIPLWNKTFFKTSEFFAEGKSPQQCPSLYIYHRPDPKPCESPSIDISWIWVWPQFSGSLLAFNSEGHVSNSYLKTQKELSDSTFQYFEMVFLRDLGISFRFILERLFSSVFLLWSWPFKSSFLLYKVNQDVHPQ